MLIGVDVTLSYAGTLTADESVLKNNGTYVKKYSDGTSSASASLSGINTGLTYTIVSESAIAATFSSSGNATIPANDGDARTFKIKVTGTIEGIAVNAESQEFTQATSAKVMKYSSDSPEQGAEYSVTSCNAVVNSVSTYFANVANTTGIREITGVVCYPLKAGNLNLCVFNNKGEIIRTKVVVVSEDDLRNVTNYEFQEGEYMQILRILNRVRHGKEIKNDRQCWH